MQRLHLPPGGKKEKEKCMQFRGPHQVMGIEVSNK